MSAQGTWGAVGFEKTASQESVFFNLASIFGSPGRSSKI